jgi:hypothetical protein
MPKSASGKRLELPIKLRWATYCREVHISPLDPNDVSLTGILQDLTIQSPEEMLPPHEVPLVVWIFAVFDIIEPLEISRRFKLTTRLDRSGLDPLIREIPIDVRPLSKYFSLNLQLNMSTRGEVCQFQSGANAIRVSFRYKEQQLGMVELPIYLRDLSKETDESPDDRGKELEEDAED